MFYEYLYDMLDAQAEEWYWEQADDLANICAECFDCDDECRYAA